MKLLFDTCVVIPVEPTHADELEPTTEIIALLLRVCQRLRCQVFTHPSSLQELEDDRQQQRREARHKLVQRYLVLSSPPSVSPELEALIGTAAPGSHDETDDNMLASVYHDAVDYLVTADAGILSKAERASIRGRVGTPSEILALLEETLPQAPEPRPSVEVGLSYELNSADPIFNPIRAEYERFDEWMVKCKRDHRPTWTIRGVDGSYAAISIGKHEGPGVYGLCGKIFKICTFRVGDPGRGYGELLLKALFDYIFLNTFDSVFVEVFPHQGGVLRLLRDFGFRESGDHTRRGEVVMVKTIHRPPDECDQMSPLEYNIFCGPQRIKLNGARVFVIPIQPRYHQVLFPGVQEQRSLLEGQLPSGNAMRKAYLSHAKIRELPPGSLLLFYRSQSRQGIYCIGVGEKSLRSSDPMKILSFVGTRTVYTVRSVEGFCRRETLVVLFRHALTLERRWTLRDMIAAGILKAHPQSISEVPVEAIPWLKTRLAKWL